MGAIRWEMNTKLKDLWQKLVVEEVMEEEEVEKYK